MMFVLRKTMESAVEAERQRAAAERMSVYDQYGKTLIQVSGLQQQLSAWVMNHPGNITPQQAAQMFYAQDDRWQAEFFNVMQEQVRAHHDSLPEGRSAGVPAGEGQWFHAMGKLSREGFETIEAMYEHAKYHHEHS